MCESYVQSDGRECRGVSHVQGDVRGVSHVQCDVRSVSHVQGDCRGVRGASNVEGDGRQPCLR